MENKGNVLIWFKFLRHMHDDWPEYLKLLRTELVPTKEMSLAQELLEKQPKATDFEESMAAIYNIQVVYDLDASNMTRGILNDKSYK